MNRPAYLSVQDVADILGHAPKTIRAWIQDGRLKASKPRRRYLVSERDRNDYIKRATVQNISKEISGL